MEILYCENCRVRIEEADVERGSAVVSGNIAYCPKCAPEFAGETAPASGSAVISGIGRGSHQKRSTRRTQATAAMRVPAARRQRSSSVHAAARKGPAMMPVAIAAIVGGLLAFGAVAILLGGSGEEGAERVPEGERPAGPKRPPGKTPPRAPEKRMGLQAMDPLDMGSGEKPAAGELEPALEAKPVRGQAVAFQQKTGPKGFVVFEAENYFARTDVGEHGWRPAKRRGGSGGKALEVADGAGFGDTSKVKPGLEYKVNFFRSGKHYVWVRGFGPDDKADSVHVGLNGKPVKSATGISGFYATWAWHRELYEQSTNACVDIPSPGVHTINVWMREDGFIVDKILLTVDSKYVPKGMGPAGSETQAYTVPDAPAAPGPAATPAQVELPPREATKVAGKALLYHQDPGPDSIVSIEAENYYERFDHGEYGWKSSTAVGHSGEGALVGTPNVGQNIKGGNISRAPRLDFRINFLKSGIHYVRVRGIGPTQADDSIHAGLDGKPVATCERIADFGTEWQWARRYGEGAGRAVIDVPSAGVHTLNIWMREDGVIIDKVVLTTSSTYSPPGTGPPESRSEPISPGGAAETGPVRVPPVRRRPPGETPEETPPPVAQTTPGPAPQPAAPPAPPAAPAAGLVGVKIGKVHSSRKYEIGVAELKARPHTDRPYPISQIPPALDGQTMVRCAMNDKNFSRADFLTIEIDRAATVYACHDARATELPAWLGDGTWKLMPEGVQTSNSPYKVYAKQYPAGKVVIGGNRDGNVKRAGASYFIIVGPAKSVRAPTAPGTTPAAPASPAAGGTVELRGALLDNSVSWNNGASRQASPEHASVWKDSVKVTLPAGKSWPGFAFDYSDDMKRRFSFDWTPFEALVVVIHNAGDSEVKMTLNVRDVASGKRWAKSHHSAFTLPAGKATRIEVPLGKDKVKDHANRGLEMKRIRRLAIFTGRLEKDTALYITDMHFARQ